MMDPTDFLPDLIYAEGLYTKRAYPCGCTAEGPGDVPAYCSEHGKPPMDASSRLHRICNFLEQDVIEWPKGEPCWCPYCKQPHSPAPGKKP